MDALNATDLAEDWTEGDVLTFLLMLLAARRRSCFCGLPASPCGNSS